MAGIEQLRHEERRAKGRAALAVQRFEDAQAAQGRAARAKDTKAEAMWIMVKTSLCQEAEDAIEALGEISWQIELARRDAMSPEQSSDYFQAMAEARVGC